MCSCSIFRLPGIALWWTASRGIFCNENGVVRVIMSGEEFRSAQGELFINENFGGSLPQFLLAFSRRKRLSEKEVEQLKKLIEEYET